MNSRSGYCGIFSEYNSTAGSRTPIVGEVNHDIISLCGSERAVDVPYQSRALPPRPPSRPNSSNSASVSRRPPPPYNPNLKSHSTPSTASKPPPPPYPGRTSTPNGPPPCEFLPQDASTPKSERDCSSPRVVEEGERREVIRDKEERAQKAMSIYENVDCDAKNESTVWYEYGCL
ncbi:hypothetical protein AB6A40_004819 [Gnathostoma spinigerum]|uniref:Uncharacterized protein n=1 Tax=Gnathostoma spinigerum TaxID=75299 RepID=A0ABD6EDN4_9BILA